jgi:hypothetical protein
MPKLSRQQFDREISNRQVVDAQSAIVEQFYLDALRTLDALPLEKYTLWFKGCWPEYAYEAEDLKDHEREERKDRFQPTAYQISIMDEILKWGRALDRNAFKIVLLRARKISFRRIADFIGVSHETVRVRYRDILDEVRTAADAASLDGGDDQDRLYRDLCLRS